MVHMLFSGTIESIVPGFGGQLQLPSDLGGTGHPSLGFGTMVVKIVYTVTLPPPNALSECSGERLWTCSLTSSSFLGRRHTLFFIGQKFW